jgi:uridine kinase
MNKATHESFVTPEEVIAEIRRLLSSQCAPIVVAVDGGSGAGKSTLAAWIADRLDVALIPLDDFFAADIPDPQWDRFTVEERLAHVFDWERMRRDAIEPLLGRGPARWQAFDFTSGLLPDGTYGMLDQVIERAPADVVLIEGAYAAGPALSDLVALAILVDMPVVDRHARLRAREAPDFLAGWHERWDPVERYYFSEVRPKSAFDLVVKGRENE